MLEHKEGSPYSPQPSLAKTTAMLKAAGMWSSAASLQRRPGVWGLCLGRRLGRRLATEDNSPTET